MKVFVILLLLGFCSQRTSNKNNLNVLGVLSLNSAPLTQQTTLVETRPFRGRTLVLLEANDSIAVYDWQRERFVEKSSQSDDIAGVSEIFASEYGRYAYVKVGNAFRILDIGLNLSPHLDHFHYERSLDYSVISTAKINLTAPFNTLPFRAYSKDGWTAFSYVGSPQGKLNFIKEKEIDLNTIPLYNAPNLPSNLEGVGIIISENLALIPTNGTSQPTEFKVYKNSSSWLELNPPITISCTNYNTLVHTQLPSPNANFQQLESGYNKIHYILISCGNTIHVVRHNDDISNSTSHFQLSTGTKEIKFLEPLFWNSNIDRGGKDVKPIFIGNTGQALENSFFLINAETNSFQEVQTKPYFYKHIATEKRTGKYIYILSNDGYIYSYGSENLQETGKTNSELPYSTQLEFRTSWNAGFLLRENEIHEYNLTEKQKTRVVTTTSKIKKDSFHDFFGPSSDYE